MPCTNSNIIVGSCVSARMHYLRNTAFASAALGVDTFAPGTRFEDDAVQVTSLTTKSGNESDAETVYLNREECSTRTDKRFADPDTSYQHVNPALVGLSGSFTTSAQLFFHFLPCAHIKDVVISAINCHARQINASWINLDWCEYLTWIMLIFIMAIFNCQDKKMYWRRGNSPFHINVNFTDFMKMSRFNDISSLHVFVVPNGELANTDPLYQTRSFLKTFNGRMSEIMRPGGYMCVDESMNQWIGNGMPNLKKVHRKQPYSVGEE